MNVRGHFSIIFAGSFIACAATHSPQPTMVQDRAPSGGGYSIFHETMADMTYPEIEAAAKRHAILLWPMGVIEEHGPQLPLGTDIYNAYAMKNSWLACSRSRRRKS